MAFNNKFKSIRSVIESAYRDSGVEEIDYDVAIADTVELIGLMGIPYNYVNKHTNGIDSPVIEVVNYRAELPYELVYIEAIRKVTVDASNNIIRSEEMIETSDIYHQTQLNIDTSINYLSPVSNAVTNELDEDEALVTTDVYVVGPTASIIKEMPYAYKINNDIIFTNFKEGYIDISYKGYATDESGMIQIPDDEKMSIALKFYLIYKLDYRKWRAFPEKPGLKALLNDSELNYYAAVAAARNKSHIPTIDGMEALKNQWLRSHNDINAHRNGFRTLNTQQQRNF